MQHKRLQWLCTKNSQSYSQTEGKDMLNRCDFESRNVRDRHNLVNLVRARLTIVPFLCHGIGPPVVRGPLWPPLNFSYHITFYNYGSIRV